MIYKYLSRWWHCSDDFFVQKTPLTHSASHYFCHRDYPPLFTTTVVLHPPYFQHSFEITCARVSFPECTHCIRRFEMHGRRVRGNRAGVRDVTLAVVTISIPRFEPPRIARWLRTGPWRKRHTDVYVQTRMSAASKQNICNANSTDENISESTTVVGKFLLGTSRNHNTYIWHRIEWLDKTQHNTDVKEWKKNVELNVSFEEV